MQIVCPAGRAKKTAGCPVRKGDFTPCLFPDLQQHQELRRLHGQGRERPFRPFLTFILRWFTSLASEPAGSRERHTLMRVIRAPAVLPAVPQLLDIDENQARGPSARVRLSKVAGRI